MIVVGSTVYWQSEPELKGVVLAMTTWRRQSLVEITNVPPNNALHPGQIVPLPTEMLVEYVTAEE